MTVSPGYIVDRWLAEHASGTLPPRVAAAAAQLERHATAWDARLDQAAWERALAVRDSLEARAGGYTHRRQAEHAIADYLEHIILPHPAAWLANLRQLPARLRECRRSGAVGMLPDGGHVICWDHKCNCNRLCPDEAREEGRRLQQRYVPALLDHARQTGVWIHHAVFTLPNARPGRLAKTKRAIFARFRRLLKKSPEIRGAQVTLEDPLSAGDAWNVHLNALLVVRGWLDYQLVRHRWHWQVELRRLSPNREALTRSLLELVKYPVRTVAEKAAAGGARMAPGEIGAQSAIHAVSLDAQAPPLTEWSPDRFLEWWQAGLGFRRTRSYGVLFRLPKPAPDLVPWEEITWIGTVSAAADHRLSISLPAIDLILAHKSIPGERPDATIRARAGPAVH